MARAGTNDRAKIVTEVSPRLRAPCTNSEEKVLLAALLAGQNRRRVLAAWGRLIQGQGDGGFGNGPGLQRLAGHLLWAWAVEGAGCGIPGSFLP